MYQDCRFKNCAYFHDKAKSMADLEKLEKDVSELKAEVHEMKETNIMLSNTFSIVLKD